MCHCEYVAFILENELKVTHLVPSKSTIVVLQQCTYMYRFCTDKHINAAVRIFYTLFKKKINTKCRAFKLDMNSYLFTKANLVCPACEK